MGDAAFVGKSELELHRVWFEPMVLVIIGLMFLGLVVTALAPAFPIWTGILPSVGLIAAVMALVGYKSGSGEVRVERGVVRWNGKLLLDGLRRADFVMRGRSGMHVLLEGRQGRALLSVADHAAADELVAAAHLAVNRTQTYRFPLPEVASKAPVAVLGVGLVALAFAVGWTEGIKIFAAASIVVAGLGATLLQTYLGVTLTVGADGLMLRQGRRTPRFIPYPELESATPSMNEETGRADGIVLRFTDGSTRTLTLPQNSPGPSAPVGEILDRIREAQKAASRVKPEGGAVAAALAQAGRSTAEWVVALRGVLGESTSYRTMPVSFDELKAVLHDGTAEKRTRLAAAIALRAADRDAGTAEVRAAASECAVAELATKLRIAVEDDVDPARLGEALDELDEAEAEDEPATAASRSRSS